jgi:hypothetical protein
MPVAPLPCPLCTGVIQVDSDWAGRQVACPLCGGAFVVPPHPPDGAISRCVVPPPPPPPASNQSISSDATDLLPPSAPAPTSVAVNEPLDELLPPGTPAAAMPPASESAGPQSFVPTIITRPKQPPAPRREPRPAPIVNRLSPKERAQRRLVKNAIVFGVCLVALVVVFYLLAR